jgi:hypothetical protein
MPKIDIAILFMLIPIALLLGWAVIAGIVFGAEALLGLIFGV